MTPSIPEDQQEKQVEVPEEAVDKFVLELFGFHKERLIGEAGDEEQRREVGRMLCHVAPAIRAQERERIWVRLAPLLDQLKEAVNEYREGKSGSGGWINRVEGEIEALFKEPADA